MRDVAFRALVIVTLAALSLALAGVTMLALVKAACFAMVVVQ